MTRQAESAPDELSVAKIIGKRLQDARNERGWSQTVAAVRLAQFMPHNYSPQSSTISRIETGAQTEPDVYLIAALCRLYRKSFHEIAPELHGDGHRMRIVIDDVVDLTACAPWELNPEPAVLARIRRNLAAQGTLFDEPAAVIVSIHDLVERALRVPSVEALSA